MPNPVIFVPGVTATEMRDVYDLPPTKIWALLTKEFDRLALHPEDTRYEANLPAQVQTDRIFEIAYKEMVLDLRHNLTRNRAEPTPVYLFGYDWRQPLEVTQAQLAAFVEEVIEKTALTKHYYKAGYANDPKVNLVGHSMGGMIITGYLASKGAAARVGKVATICTPFRGSLNAVEKLIVGTRNQREREAARLTPSLYYLLPSYKKGIEIDASLGADLFDANVWQKSLSQTIRTELEERGSGAVPATPDEADKILQRLLTDAATHRAMLEAFEPDVCGLKPEDWLYIVGTGETTRVELKVTVTDGLPDFKLGDYGVANGPEPRTGDGTVPIEGAKSGFMDKVTEVKFSHKDFGLLEFKDKLLDAGAPLHGIIPNMNKLQSRLVAHLK